MEKAALTALSEVKLDYRSLTFLFLPHEVDALEEAFAHAVECGGLQDVVYINRIEDFKRLLDAQSKVQASYDVKNSATSLMLILDVFGKHQEDLQQGYISEEGELKHKNKVPLSSVFGDDIVPAELALLLKKALDRMIGRGEIEAKQRFDFLRVMAERYLAGD